MTMIKDVRRRNETLYKMIAYSSPYMYSAYASSLQLLNVSSRLTSTQVDMPLSSQVKSSRMTPSRPPSTWGHFSLKSGHVSVPQRLAGLPLRRNKDIYSRYLDNLPEKDRRLSNGPMHVVQCLTIFAMLNFTRVSAVFLCLCEQCTFKYAYTFFPCRVAIHMETWNDQEMSKRSGKSRQKLEKELMKA